MPRAFVVFLLAALAAATAPLAGAADSPPAPKPLTRVAPDYPEQAWLRGIDGRVTTLLTIDAKGHVAATKALVEDPKEFGFAEAAATALRQWVFPAGQAGNYKVAIKFDYQPPDGFTPEAAALPEANVVREVLPHRRRSNDGGDSGHEAPPSFTRARVVVAVRVGDDGEVVDARILQDYPTIDGLGPDIVDNIDDWEFAPGKPGLYRLTVDYDAKAGLTAEERDLPGAPKPIERVHPKYPKEGLEQNLNGVAVIVVTINTDGTVAKTRVAQEQPPGYGFGEAAAKAVTQWVFPSGSGGIYTVTFQFSVSDMAAGRDTPSTIAVEADKLPPAPEPSSRHYVDYPSAAKEQGVEGWADLGAQIDEKGRVANLGVLAESPAGMGFGKAAYDSVRRWRFRGTPVGAYRIHVEFKLDVEH